MMLKTALKLFGSAASLFLLMIFLFPISRNILNIGNIFGIIVSGLLSYIFLFGNRFSLFVGHISENRRGRVVIFIIGCFTALTVVYFMVLSVLMARAERDEPRSDKTTLVVLGCKVKNGAPSLMLQRRLDAAYDYLSVHDGSYVVVSGGKGSDEVISEAQCMRDYLTERGISPDRMIMEDKSVSTDENIEFSLELIRKNGLPENVTIVTDGYHQFRAECIAKRKGYEKISNISASTTWWLVPTYWVREWFGITYLIVFGG